MLEQENEVRTEKEDSIPDDAAEMEQIVEAGDCREDTEKGSENELLRVIEERLSRLNQNVEILEQRLDSHEKGDSAISDTIHRMEDAMQGISEKQERNDRQLTNVLRENANFQIQVRQGMQGDLDTLRKQQSGEQFVPILKEIASIYAEYQMLRKNCELPEQHRKSLDSLFEQLEDLLMEYGAETFSSSVGEKRNPRTTKIIEKIPVGDREKHNTIVLSRKPGVAKGNLVLYYEFVDVYIYDPVLDQKPGLTEVGQERLDSENNLLQNKEEM